MTNQTIVGAQQIDAANKAMTSQALIIQNYADSVLTQPKVDFSGFKTLKTYETQINDDLLRAQGHANNYLNVIQPNIIANISNIGNYYGLHQSLHTVLPPGSTEAEWLKALGSLQEQAETYASDSGRIVVSLQALHTNLASDASSMDATVSELNAAVKGDNGVLAGLTHDIAKTQGEIDGAIAGIALSGLAIIGGVFMIVVGAVADFVTAGTTTGLIIGGIGIVTAGVAGEAGSIAALVALSKAKTSLIQQQQHLESEVKLAAGISQAYSSLEGQVKSAVKAADQMKNAWGFLKSDLTNLAADIQAGRVNTGVAREMFLTQANTEIKTVTTDIDTIKTQMAGVRGYAGPANQNIADAIEAAAKQVAA